MAGAEVSIGTQSSLEGGASCSSAGGHMVRDVGIVWITYSRGEDPLSMNQFAARSLAPFPFAPFARRVIKFFRVEVEIRTCGFWRSARCVIRQ